MWRISKLSSSPSFPLHSRSFSRPRPRSRSCLAFVFSFPPQFPFPPRSRFRSCSRLAFVLSLPPPLQFPLRPRSHHHSRPHSRPRPHSRFCSPSRPPSRPRSLPLVTRHCLSPLRYNTHAKTPGLTNGAVGCPQAPLPVCRDDNACVIKRKTCYFQSLR